MSVVACSFYIPQMCIYTDEEKLTLQLGRYECDIVVIIVCITSSSISGSVHCLYAAASSDNSDRYMYVGSVNHLQCLHHAIG